MARTATLFLMLVCSSLTFPARAQSGTQAPSPAQKKPSRQNEEQILLRQLNDKFEELEKLNEKYERLEQEVQELRKQLIQRNAAEQPAIAATPPAPSTPAQPAAAGTEIPSLQTQIAELTTKNHALTESVASLQNARKAQENAPALRFRGIELTPGGFLAGETVVRQRAIGGDVNTSFGSIPFAGQTAGALSEFNASGRQSRISLLAEGKLPEATLRGFYEADFLSAGTTSNDNQSNSYTMRQRQLWAQAVLPHGWTLTSGQMWSLATEYKSGLSNGAEAIPLTIDSQYNVGFTWERQYGFRIVKQLGDHFWIGGSIEESQTLNIGGHNLPTIAFQQAGNASGLYNPSANYSYNYAPDLIAKVAYETGNGHLELFGVGRFFRDRVFPNAQAVTPSALGAYTAKTEGGGIGANATISLFNRKLDAGAHILIGNGMGRYGSSTLPDATAHPDGSLALLTGGSALARLEWHATPRLDVYGYYGGEYAKRAFYATGLYVTSGPYQNQPILAGYGAPNNILTGCSVEVLPSTSSNGGGNVPGTAANCQADNRNIQEGTFGYWFRFYQGPHGTLQQGLQYSYAVRHTWLGIGDPITGLGGSPKAIDNMWFTSFRYYLPR